MADRQCSKPICHDVAVATMSYDYATRTVFVGRLLVDRQPNYYDLCRTHTDALVPPRGWTMRREPIAQAGAFDENWSAPVLTLKIDRSAM
jgi:Protein of unknown function (DUF3499)